jgi:hypothetical protein
MTERTVTEKQVIDAMTKHPFTTKYTRHGSRFIDELFPEPPELPKYKELIQVSDNCEPTVKDWYPFVGINHCGRVIVLDDDGNDELWDNYRRQTPAERGEG